MKVPAQVESNLGDSIAATGSLLGRNGTCRCEAVEIGDRLVNAYDIGVLLVHVE
jgi:hypothetical protein